MTGPRTYSHPIYARTLTGVYQAVRMFSPCYFHVITVYPFSRNVSQLYYTFAFENFLNAYVYLASCYTVVCTVYE